MTDERPGRDLFTYPEIPSHNTIGWQTLSENRGDDVWIQFGKDRDAGGYLQLTFSPEDLKMKFISEADFRPLEWIDQDQERGVKFHVPIESPGHMIAYVQLPSPTKGKQFREMLADEDFIPLLSQIMKMWLDHKPAPVLQEALSDWRKKVMVLWTPEEYR